jgi:hypothetical protein
MTLAGVIATMLVALPVLVAWFLVGRFLRRPRN